MDGENNGKPYFQMDDLGGFPPIFGNTHILNTALNLRDHSFPRARFPMDLDVFQPKVGSLFKRSNDLHPVFSMQIQMHHRRRTLLDLLKVSLHAKPRENKRVLLCFTKMRRMPFGRKGRNNCAARPLFSMHPLLL